MGIKLIKKKQESADLYTVYLDGAVWAEDVTKEKARAIVDAYDGEKDCWMEKSDSNADEAATFTAIKNPKQAAFIIDCGSPEKAKALCDAFDKAAYNETGSELTSKNLGGDPVQWWNVGPFFTACVDPCDKAAAWCENWLRNSDGAVPGIQDNSAGLESKAREALSPKMQQRLKVNAWQEATDKMKGFDEAGHTLLDMIGKDGKYNTIALPIEGMATEAEALEAAKKIFGDFEDYINFGADFDDLDEAWYPYYGLKKEFFGLTKEEGLAVLKEFDDALYKAITKGIKAFK